MAGNQPPQEQLTHEELNTHLIEELGVSPDIRIVSFLECAMATTWGLVEKESGTSLNTPTEAPRKYEVLSTQGGLPSRLREKGAFMHRYNDLIGLLPGTRRDSELAITVRRNRHLPDPDAELQFEQRMGQFLSSVVTSMVDAPFLKQTQELSIFRLEHVDGAGKCLTTRNGLQARLPLKHAGVVQLAPDVNDALVRFHEAQMGGGWPIVALVNNNPFNEAFNRSIAVDMHRVAAKRVIATGEGPAHGIDTLIEQRQRNKSLKAGFGAIVLSAVGHLPIDEVRAFIRRSPELLAPGGVLGISDVENFDDGYGVWNLIKAARKAFGSEYEDIKAMFSTDGREGRQAVFKKTRAAK
jgi:hypothetical protein